jgi:hypothetical protein
MSSIVVDANNSTELAELPIESAKPTLLAPVSPVMATPALVGLGLAAFIAGYEIGRDLGAAFGRQPRLPSDS